MKNKNGVTLIALVVTIIILLILTGVAIMALSGENGLINKITIAKNRQSENEAEEKLKLKIMELQTEIVQKEGRQAVLEDLNSWTNSESDYYDKEITSVTDNQENTNKLVEINGYIFEVDENLNIVGIIEADITSKTETTYQINSIDGDVMQITIKIKNSSGIEKVITPEGKEIIPQTDKEEIEIDYEVTSGNNYTFKVNVSGSDEVKEYVLKADVNAKPEIDQNESYAYPILTKYGIETNKIVEIDYGEGINNYYSIDDGNTWNKYKGKIKIESECNLIAKTLIEGEITRESKKEITLELANDAISYDAYDDDLTSYDIVLNKYIMISDDLEGYTIDMYLMCPQWNHIYVQFYSEDKTTAVGDTGYWHTNNNVEKILSIQVPENTKWLKFITVEGYADICYLYNIELNTTPIGDETKLYSYIDDKGVHFDSRYIIKYCGTANQKLYSKDNENWIDYPEDGVFLEKGETVYAKSIDIKGNESKILTYTHNIENIIGTDAYDTDVSTCFNCNPSKSPYYIYIDPSAYGKEVYFNFTANLYSDWRFNFYNVDGEKSDEWPSVVNGNSETNLTIPTDVQKLEIIYSAGSRGLGCFYELRIIN